MFAMREVNLARVDLNLLVALRSLLATCSVTRTGTELGLSQPTVSRLLARLRELFGDPLLVRVGGRLVATPRAESLVLPLDEALTVVAAVLRPPGFDPATARGTITIVAKDYDTLLIGSRFLGRARREAPGIDLSFVNSAGLPMELIESGAAMLAFGVAPNAASHIYRQPLLDDGFVAAVRPGHPILAGDVTLDRYLAFDHALVTIDGLGPSIIDERLERLGRKRRVALRLPHFLAAPALIATTDLIIALPRRVVDQVPGLVPVPLPPEIQVDGFSFVQFWHARWHRDPAHIWLRALIASAVRSAP